MRQRSAIAAGLLGIAVLGAVAKNNGAHLGLALEDKADPNPRQMKLGMRIVGLCFGLAISWSDRKSDQRAAYFN